MIHDPKCETFVVCLTSVQKGPPTRNASFEVQIENSGSVKYLCQSDKEVKRLSPGAVFLVFYGHMAQYDKPK